MKMKAWIESDKMTPSKNLVREFKTFVASGKSYEAVGERMTKLVQHYYVLDRYK